MQPKFLKSDCDILSIMHMSPKKSLSFWILHKFPYAFLISHLLAGLHVIFLEKVILKKKFPAFRENLRFVTTFITARHCPLSLASLIHSATFHSIVLQVREREYRTTKLKRRRHRRHYHHFNYFHEWIRVTIKLTLAFDRCLVWFLFPDTQFSDQRYS